jgi:predicted DNA-binding transcriptional regulator YafY
VGRVDPVERVLNLLTLLHESRRPLSRAEIMTEMAQGSTPYPTHPAAQHQLFTSDRQTITAGLGIAIHQRVRRGDDAGRTEYWIDRRDVHLPELHLDDDERLALSMALAAVSRSLPTAGEASLKLGAGWSAESPFDFSVEVPDVVIAMMNAAQRGAVVELAVTGGRFEFEPWAVVLDHGVWYAVGHDAVRGAARSVRLDQLVGDPVMVDRHRAVPRPELDARLLTSLLDEAHSAPLVAQVLVDEVAAARASLSGQVRERSQPDLFGHVTMWVIVDDAARLRNWMLGLGDRAELLAPAELRNDVMSWLRAVAEQRQSGIDPPPRPPASTGRRPGPEPVATRLERLLAIVPWLYQQRTARVDDVAARVGATTEQILRDLTVASMCGMPPYSSDALYGFWVDPEEGTVNVIQPTLLTDEVRLTVPQAAAVAVALSAVEALPGGGSDVSKRLREKLDAAVGDLPVRVALDEPPLLDDVRTAVERRERIRIEYVDLDDRVTERTVDPLRLFVDRGSAYIIADDHLRVGERVFQVDRLLSVAPTGEHFEPRPVRPPAGRTWAWMVPDREVVVRLPPGSNWVLDRYATAAHVADAEGWLTVWLSVVSEGWLATVLLRCGPGAEVLAPSDLRDLPARRARAALARYG